MHVMWEYHMCNVLSWTSTGSKVRNFPPCIFFTKIWRKNKNKNKKNTTNKRSALLRSYTILFFPGLVICSVIFKLICVFLLLIHIHQLNIWFSLAFIHNLYLLIKFSLIAFLFVFLLFQIEFSMRPFIIIIIEQITTSNKMMWWIWN